MAKAKLDQPLCQKCSNYDNGNCAHLAFVLESVGAPTVIEQCPLYNAAIISPTASDTPTAQEK